MAISLDKLENLHGTSFYRSEEDVLYIHTYIHANIQKIQICKYAYIPTYLNTYNLTYIYAYMYAYIHIHTYIHTYIYTYIHKNTNT